MGAAGSPGAGRGRRGRLEVNPAEAEGAWKKLTDGLSLLRLELTESRISALRAYVAGLERWNATYNLTSVRSPSEIVRRHLLDCLATLEPLRRQVGRMEGRSLLDVGTGAGLPGLLYALCEPELQVTCVDSVGKKIAFVRSMAAELGLSNLTAVHSRVEHLHAGHRFDVISSRAFSSLNQLVQLTDPMLALDGVWLAMKGKVPLDEIDFLAHGVTAFHVEHLRVPGLGEERCIVWLRSGNTA